MPRLKAVHQVDPEDVEHDPGGAEHADLDHGHRMEQGGDRGRGDHGTGQPVMKRHDAVLGKAEEAEDIEHDHHRLAQRRREDAGGDVGGEIKRAGQHIDQDHGRQQEDLGGGGQVDDIFPASFVAFLVLVMGDQRIGADGDDLVEEIQGEQVVGEGHPDGPEDRQGKTGVEPGLGMLLEAAHVAHRIKDRNHPQR